MKARSVSTQPHPDTVPEPSPKAFLLPIGPRDLPLSERCFRGFLVITARAVTENTLLAPPWSVAAEMTSPEPKETAAVRLLLVCSAVLPIGLKTVAPMGNEDVDGSEEPAVDG